MGFKERQYNIAQPIKAARFLLRLGYTKAQTQRMLDKSRLHQQNTVVKKSDMLHTGTVNLVEFIPQDLGLLPLYIGMIDSQRQMTIFRYNENYKDYDLFWPIVMRDAEEEITPAQIDTASLYPYTDFTLEYLRSFLATTGETFVSETVMTETRFGKYEVKADLFTATSYNEYLQKLLRVVTTRMDRVGVRSTRTFPTLQINQPSIIRVLDDYIRTRLFGQPFNPFEGNDWKILLAKNGVVTSHIIREMSIAIHRMQENVMVSEAVVEKVWFSSVQILRIRESYSMALQKVIYEKVGYPSNRGGFEKAFSEFLDRDGEVECFLKINENQHAFASLFYLRKDGLLASYHPDFIVRTATHLYIIETKADDCMADANVRQNQKAAVEWCRKINTLSASDRMEREWEYILLPESLFYSLERNGATLEEMCRLNKVSSAMVSGVLWE